VIAHAMFVTLLIVIPRTDPYPTDGFKAAIGACALRAEELPVASAVLLRRGSGPRARRQIIPIGPKRVCCTACPCSARLAPTG
jgi:hypothetical protein